MEARIEYDTWWAEKQNRIVSDKETHTMSTRRFGLWERDDTTKTPIPAMAQPEYHLWGSAVRALHHKSDFTKMSLAETGFRIWDFSQSPPADVTDYPRYGAGEMPAEEQEEPQRCTGAVLPIPSNVREIHIKRIPNNMTTLSLTVKGEEWGWNVVTTDGEVTERIQAIAKAAKELE